jgi:hypothetical protein
MIRVADLTLWLLTTFVQSFVVYLFSIQGLLRKFLFLNIYLLLSAVSGVARYVAYSHFGFASDGYIYFYYSSEALLTIFLFLSICELSLVLVGTKILRRRVMLWSLGAFVLTSLLSFSVASSGDSGVVTRFLFELSEQIFYVCCIAVVLLWAWNLRNDPADRMAARFANVLAVYLSLFFLIYAASRLTPHASSLDCLHLMGFAWLPLGCGFVIVSHQSSTH